MYYKLLAIDLDGTLLNEHGRISDANRRAVDAAREAGAIVLPCTGRGWRESHMVLHDLPGLDLGVFVTGAAITDIPTGQSVDLAVIEPHLAHDLVRFLGNEPEAVLVYREANLAGHDYLITGNGELTRNTEWWFQYSGANVHFQRDVGPDDLHHVLRVGLVAEVERLPELTRGLKERFGDRILLHHFEALTVEGAATVHVLEVFAAGCDKWRGIEWIAQQHNIQPEEIACFGDSINDLSMLHASGCGIAMANGTEDARAAANRITESNAEDGVAKAIDRLLRGEW